MLPAGVTDRTVDQEASDLSDLLEGPLLHHISNVQHSVHSLVRNIHLYLLGKMELDSWPEVIKRLLVTGRIPLVFCDAPLRAMEPLAVTCQQGPSSQVVELAKNGYDVTGEVESSSRSTTVCYFFATAQ